MRQGTDITHPDANRIVVCRACQSQGVDKSIEARKLNSHLGGKHTQASGDYWDKARYIKAYGDDDFWELVPDHQVRAERRIQMQELNAVRSKPENLGEAQDLLVTDNREKLTDEERDFYDTFCEDTFQKIERDDTQLPAISGLAFDLILAQRLRQRMLNATAKKISTEIAEWVSELEKTLKTTEERIAKQTDKLGLSREAQHKRGQAVKTSVSMLISAYLDEVERTKPEIRDAMKLEEQKVWQKAMARIEEHILAVAPDPTDEVETEGDNDGAPLTLREALAKAGIASGGTSPVSQSSLAANEESELPF